VVVLVVLIIFIIIDIYILKGRTNSGSNSHEEHLLHEEIDIYFLYRLPLWCFFYLLPICILNVVSSSSSSQTTEGRKPQLSINPPPSAGPGTAVADG
jgi:hypothetical protein